MYKEQLKALINSKEQNNITLAFEIAKGLGQNALDTALTIWLNTFGWNCYISENTFPDITTIQKLSLQLLFSLEIPEHFSRLKSLLEFNIMNSSIGLVPEVIFELENLERLTLVDSKIKELPPKISKLKNLKELNLNSNHLVNLPDEISELQNLESLHLTNNLFSHIPKQICKLKNLKELSLSFNPKLITKENLNIPQELVNLKNLESVDLYRTKQMDSTQTNIKEISQQMPNTKFILPPIDADPSFKLTYGQTILENGIFTTFI